MEALLETALKSCFVISFSTPWNQRVRVFFFKKTYEEAGDLPENFDEVSCDYSRHDLASTCLSLGAPNTTAEVPPQFGKLRACLFCVVRCMGTIRTPIPLENFHLNRLARLNGIEV